MKKMLCLLLLFVFVLAGCSAKTGSLAAPAIPTGEGQEAAPSVTFAPTPAPTLALTPGIVSFLEFLDSLDRTDVTTGAKAVQALKEAYAAQDNIPDEDVTALIRYIEDMRPEHYSMFPDTASYPERGLVITDWTLDGMRVFYENYLYAEHGEGSLYFLPDYTRIGMELYDDLSQEYKVFFEMQFDIGFFKLQKLFDDGVPAVNESDLMLALEIYTMFMDGYPGLAAEHGIDRMAESIRSFVAE